MPSGAWGQQGPVLGILHKGAADFSPAITGTQNKNASVDTPMPASCTQLAIPGFPRAY